MEGAAVSGRLHSATQRRLERRPSTRACSIATQSVKAGAEKHLLETRWQRDGGIQVTLAEDEYAKQKVWINDNTS